jgi:hypothetical protein
VRVQLQEGETNNTKAQEGTARQLEEYYRRKRSEAAAAAAAVAAAAAAAAAAEPPAKKKPDHFSRFIYPQVYVSTTAPPCGALTRPLTPTPAADGMGEGHRPGAGGAGAGGAGATAHRTFRSVGGGGERLAAAAARLARAGGDTHRGGDARPPLHWLREPGG